MGSVASLEYWNAGWIPGLAQWVNKDLVLLHLRHRSTTVAPIWSLALKIPKEKKRKEKGREGKGGVEETSRGGNCSRK